MRFVPSRLAAGLAALFIAPRAPATVEAPAAPGENPSGAPIAQTVRPATVEDDERLPGRWDAVPGSPCGTLVALDPATALGPLAFVACPSNEPGCTAPAPEPRVVLGAGPEVVRLVDGTPMMAYVRIRNGSSGARAIAVNVVEPLGKAPVFAVAGPLGRPACTFASHVGRFGFALSPVPYAGQHGPMLLAWAPFDEPSELSLTHVAVASWPGARVWADAEDVPALAVASRTLFVQTELGVNGPVRGRDWSSAVRVFDPLANELAVPCAITARSPVAVGDGAVALLQREGRAALGFIGPSGTAIVLRRPPARYDVTSFAVDRSGAHDVLVWTEPAGQDAWLYAAPFETPATALQTTRVGIVGDPAARGGLVANGGEVLSLDPDGRARIVRLATGASSWRSPSPTEHFRRPLWVDEHEIWLETDHGIVRLAR